MVLVCPLQLPDDLTEPLRRFANSWVESPLRPSVEAGVAQAWEALVEEWICASALPLYIRKSSATRGEVVVHRTGRSIIPCDNSPAVWAFTLAAGGDCPSLAEIDAWVRNRQVPFAFTRLRGRFAHFYAAGWKLAHIDDVGLRTRERLEDIPISKLEDHFRKLVMPSNMFAIPKRWAGLGEIPEVIEAMRALKERVTVGVADRSSRSGLRSSDEAASARIDAPQGDERSIGPAKGGTLYAAARLLFRASVIEPLADEQAFRIATPEGIYEMTKAEFRRTFANVAASETYRRKGVYSYSRTPEKARQYLLNERQLRSDP